MASRLSGWVEALNNPSPVVASGKTPRRRKSPSTPLRKNIPLYRSSELRHKSKQPGPTKRGGSRVVRNAGRVAVDAAASGARG